MNRHKDQRNNTNSVVGSLVVENSNPTKENEILNLNDKVENNTFSSLVTASNQTSQVNSNELPLDSYQDSNSESDQFTADLPSYDHLPLRRLLNRESGSYLLKYMRHNYDKSFRY